ncbi:20479_t:CDS:1, partial [Funneliformis geosporum]
DLGLCKHVEYFQSSINSKKTWSFFLSKKHNIFSFKNNDIYGVLPFIVPEVLRDPFYTLANNIYSFSMIMWEFISEVIPFDNKAYDF